MKRVLIFVLALSMFVFAKDKKVEGDCVESLENEIIGIVYKSVVVEKKHPAVIEKAKVKIDKTLEKDCLKEVVKEKNSSKKEVEKNYDQDCIDELQNEIIKIIEADEKHPDKDKILKIKIDKITKEINSSCLK